MTAVAAPPLEEAGSEFAAFGLRPELLRGIRELGFSRPTPIQIQAIPPALGGRDLLACASTGTGKTAAFALPILERLGVGPRRVTRALVLTPTRELALQIREHFDRLGAHTSARASAVVGGQSPGPQERALRQGAEVIVATPGRLLDHLRRPYAALRGLEVLVLDEADRMLDMGFLPDVRRVIAQLPRRRQTLLFSATMPREIAALAGEMLNEPYVIDVERRRAPAVTINQVVYPVEQRLKSALLLSLLRRGDMKSALVFTRTKHRANRLADWLFRQGVRVERIHGNRSQSQRTKALEGFKAGAYQALVATDIAARGIDVAALGHVVNFDVPLAADDYIHRVGRTGRAEASGEAVTFVAPEEQSSLGGIERALNRSIPQLRLPDLDQRQPPTGVPFAANRTTLRRTHVVAPWRGRADGRREGRRGSGGTGPAHGPARRRRLRTRAS